MKTQITAIATAAGLAILLFTACSTPEQQQSEIARQSFGQIKDGAPVDLYPLINSNGLRAEITNYGGIITSLQVPDRNGRHADVALGFDTLNGYLGEHPYFGAIVGRYGNRIAQGKFTLNGATYTLARNNGENSLHGGVRGFDKVVWEAKEFTGQGECGLELTYVSKDGEEGYPGNLTAVVRYTLTDQDELKIDYSATTDKDTVLNLTNHSYFNLAGHGEGDILNHQVKLYADRFTPVSASLIPTGELKSVRGTPFDFTEPTAIGARIGETDEQLKFGIGYDHNFVVNGEAGTLRPAAEVYEPRSGRVLEVLTTEPGMQFYTGNFLDGTIHGKGGKVYNQRYGFCLETQHFPDSPNQPSFPSTVLKTGDRYTSQTVFRFSTR
jgi:aldose 1-epimerase